MKNVFVDGCLSEASIYSESIFHISQLFLYFLSSNLLIASTLFIFDMVVQWWLLPFSFGAAICFLAIFYDKKIRLHDFLTEIIIAVLIICFLVIFCGSFYDISWDGNNYHKLAVGLLKNYWNPLKELPYGKTLESVIGSDEGSMWVEVYAKATWIFAASVYALTNNIETGKIYTLLGMFCAFGFTFHYLSQMRKSVSFSLLFSLIAALNPVAVAQMRTFYVDGYLQIILYIVVLSLIWFVGDIDYAIPLTVPLDDYTVHSDQLNQSNPIKTSQVISQKTAASILVSSMIICVNIKFTGLLYGGIFCIAYYFWFCASTLKNVSVSKKSIKCLKCIKYGIFFAILAATTIFWAGNSTYYTNIIRHQSPVYPLTGGEAFEIDDQSPFESENNFKNVIISMFSEMSNIIYKYKGNHDTESYKLKIPFTIHGWNELKNLITVDTRLSGFGFFFSGILLLSLLAIIIKLFTMRKSKNFYFFLMNLFVNFGLCFAIKQSWWARYTPYIYFIVLAGIYIILDSAIITSSKIAKLVLILLIFVNNLSFILGLGASLVYSYKGSRVLSEMKNHRAIYFDTRFKGIFFNLKDEGIHYIVKKDVATDVSPFLGVAIKWLPID